MTEAVTQLVVYLLTLGNLLFPQPQGKVLSSGNYTKEVRPSSVTLALGHSQQFCMWAKFENYDFFQETDDSISWAVVNGGGTISDNGACGTFTAGTMSGSFSNTIKGDSHGDVRYASVTVENSSGNNPTATPTPTSQPTSTPTPSSSGSGGGGGSTTPTSTPYPTYNPTYYPTAYPTNYSTYHPSPYPSYYLTPHPSAYPSYYPIYSPTYYPTPYPTSTAIGGTLQYTKMMEPSLVKLNPGQSYQFQMVVVMANGSRWPEYYEQVSWNVVNGGGAIDNRGVFTAGQQLGLFTNTARGETYGDKAYATVEIVSQLIHTTPTPIPTQTYQQANFYSYYQNYPDTSGHNYQDYYQYFYPGTTSLLPSPPPSPTQISTSGMPTGVYVPLEAAAQSLFRQLDARVIECLRSQLTEEEFSRFMIPVATEVFDIDQWLNKQTQINQCLQLKRVPKLADDTQECLVKNLGEDKFKDLYYAVRPPTQAELNQGAVCFSQPNLVKYNAVIEEEPLTKACLQLKVGKERLAKIQSGELRPTQEELAQGRECFNLDTNLLKPPMVIQASDEQTTCLKQQLGEERFNQIVSAHQPPTDKEKQQAQSCFEDEKIKTQQAFLPPPPEQLPFIPVSTTDTAITQVDSSPAVEDVKDTLVLSGRGLPDSLVDIYLFSQPIVVTTKTDANGDWQYQLAYHLPEGDHQAYTVVRHPEQGLVRSEVFDFGVAYARESDNDPTPELLVVQRSQTNRMRGYLLAASAVVLLGAAFLLLVFRWRLSRRVNQTNALQPVNPPVANPPISV